MSEPTGPPFGWLDLSSQTVAVGAAAVGGVALGLWIGARRWGVGKDGSVVQATHPVAVVAVDAERMAVEEVTPPSSKLTPIVAKLHVRLLSCILYLRF